MSRATHKQKLAFANIWGRYRHDPVATGKFNTEANPGHNLMEWILGDKCPDEIKADLRRVHVLSACVREVAECFERRASK